MLSSLTRDDEIITLTTEETIAHLLNSLLPDDCPITINRMQDIESRDYDATMSTENKTNTFTAGELDTIVDELKDNKAPGLDIKSKIIKLNWTKSAVFKIYNAS